MSKPSPPPPDKYRVCWQIGDSARVFRGPAVDMATAMEQVSTMNGKHMDKGRFYWCERDDDDDLFTPQEEPTTP